MPEVDRIGRMGVGTAAFLPSYGVHGALHDVREGVLSAALAGGLSYFDTAPAYGDAERALGAALSESPALPVRVTTKVTLEGARSGQALESLGRSLAHLRRGSVDTVLVHNAAAEDLIDPAVIHALEECRAAGLCRRLGVTTYGVQNARAAVQCDWCDSVQFEFSLLNPSVLSAIRPLKRAGQEWIARSVLCRGLLTDAFYPSSRDPGVREALEKARGLAARVGASLEQVAIDFALSEPTIDRTLVGLANETELTRFLACRRPLSLSLRDEALLGTLDRSACWETHPELWGSGAPAVTSS